MKRSFPILLLLAAFVAGCGLVDTDTPGHEPGLVTQSFVRAVRACGAPLSANGHIDDRALATAGWHSTGRTESRETIDRYGEAGGASTVRYVRTEERYAAAPGVPDNLIVTRSIGLPDVPQFREALFFDACTINTRARSAAEANTVRDGLSNQLRMMPEHLGELSEGGDWLLPRSSSPFVGYLWRQPQHDIMLKVREREVVLEVQAIPIRPPDTDVVRRLKNAGVIE